MLGVYWLLYRPQSAATERLRRLGGSNEGSITQSAQSVVIPEDSPATELAQRLAQPLNKLLPPSATEAKKLQKKLMHAGFRSAESPIIYRAIQLASMAGDLYHRRVRCRFLPAALHAESNYLKTPATHSLGTRGRARLNGRFS
jgi:hypothetical protein